MALGRGYRAVYILGSINSGPSDQTDLKEWRRCNLGGDGEPTFEAEADMLMETGIPIFHQVMITIVVAENDTPIRLQIERSNPSILAPQLLWLSTET